MFCCSCSSCKGVKVQREGERWREKRGERDVKENKREWGTRVVRGRGVGQEERVKGPGN